MSGKPLSTPVAPTHGATERAVMLEQMTTWIEQLVTRRGVLSGATALGLAGFAGLVLGGCEGDQGEPGPAGPTGPAGPAGPPGPAAAGPLEFNFRVVSLNQFDRVTVPEGHSAHVLYAYGDPISPDLSGYSNVGTESGLEWDRRAGDNHDGMHFFGLNDAGELDPSASDRGILCINHEYINQPLMHRGTEVSRDADGVRDSVDEVRKEQRAHGVSCIEIVRDDPTGRFTVVQDSPFNRRITALTPMDLRGPAAGSGLLATRYSPDGTHGRGTLNNCANGYTPWGTYLTCEENYDLYFRDDRTIDNEPREVPSEIGYANFLAGIGVRVPGGRYEWATLAGHPEERDDEFSRFSVTPKTGLSAAEDYRNEGNQFGYIVEIDPLDPQARPRKRTALGRFAHEGVWPAYQAPGKPVVFYMGDDDQLQFIYKFVSAATYTPGGAGAPLDTGDTYMDDGTLYAARFDADPLTGRQTGVWIPLRPDNPDLAAASRDAGNPFAGLFATLDSILVHTRAAAFVAGATPMDRPEWGAVNPRNGEVYFTLTNNSDRRGFEDRDPVARAAGDQGTRDEVTEFLADREFVEVASNPRGPNRDGHIIRLRENGSDPGTLGFAWDIFVYGSAADGETNFSGLTRDNEFGSCDGLWFDPAGLLWIQTDGRQPGDNHDQMLAAVPGEVSDGGIDAGNNDVTLRRFLVGPQGCEVTGVDMTPDRRCMFVNIQHPTGHWPDGNDATMLQGTMGRARSATIVITRDDGGPIGTDGTNRV